MASSFVNGFVNAGFGHDKLLMEDGQKWLYKNKEHGMMSATASIGLVLLWDVDGGLTQIDKYLYSPEDYIKGQLIWKCSFSVFKLTKKPTKEVFARISALASKKFLFVFV